MNVNIEKGEKQSLLVQKLLSKAAEAGLSKEDIVLYKNELLQEAWKSYGKMKTYPIGGKRYPSWQQLYPSWQQLPWICFQQIQP